MTDEELIAAAASARSRAYAPYSGYQVGAAVLAGGQVFTGANIENASYGLAVCAERHAVAQAVFAGHTSLERVAVVTSSRPAAAPCGACRQVLNEFAADPRVVTVLMATTEGEHESMLLSELLPRSFGPAQLPEHT